MSSNLSPAPFGFTRLIPDNTVLKVPLQPGPERAQPGTGEIGTVAVKSFMVIPLWFMHHELCSDLTSRIVDCHYFFSQLLGIQDEWLQVQ
jgi:hypothetical protein